MGKIYSSWQSLAVMDRLLLVAGVSGMFFALVFDLLRTGNLQFGTMQFAGFVVGAFVAAAGLRRSLLSESRLWDGLLLLAYLSGTLYMGLRFDSGDRYRSRGYLRSMAVSMDDALINIIGFIPLGYLMAKFLLAMMSSRYRNCTALFALAACALVSAMIEISQFYLPGRSSSIVDLNFNSLGAFAGVLLCMLEYSWIGRARNRPLADS